MKGTTTKTLLTLICLLAFTSQSFALGLLLPEKMSRRIMPPTALPDEVIRELIPVPAKQMLPLEISDQTVTVNIKDQVTKTKVDQRFRNKTNRVLEGSFLFPLPAGSTISDFALYINGKRQRGEMLEAKKAKSIYEGIVRRMEDPALLEYVGENLFKARVYPIPARGERRIDMTFEQVLKLDNGLCQYTLPLRAPRNFKQPIKNFTLTLNLESQRPIKSIYSPSHNVHIKRQGDHKAVVSFEAENLKLDKDFVLMYSVDEKSFGCSLLTHRPDEDEDGYFMLLLTPKQQLTDDEIVPKDVTFVVDTSGSMNGEKMEKAKDALLLCVNSLEERDNFNVVGFSTDVNPLWSRLKPATGKNIKKARKFIKRKLRAAGGTAINDALLEALKHKPEKGRPYMVVFMTDGKPTVGPRNVNAIVGNVKNKLRKGTRVFSLGVGDRVNTKLLDSLSSKYSGVSEYIRPNEDIEIKMSSFYTKIASPVMADIELGFGDINVVERFPKQLPDLFKGSQIEIVGRYRDHGNIALMLSGIVGKERVKLAYDAEFPEEDDSNEFLQRLWAQRKVAYLMDEIRLNGMNNELREEIVRLGKKYCIETPYTSFLVVEDESQLRQPPPPPGRIGRRPRPTAPRPRFFDRRMSSMEGGPAGGGARDSFDGFSAGEKMSYGAPTSARGISSLRAKRKAPAMAPMDFEADSGARAVETANKLKEMKKSAVVKTESNSLTQMVGARTFYNKNGVWTDSSYKSDMKTLTIKYDSDAFMTAITTLKKLKRCLTLGKEIIIVYKGKALKITASEGKETIEASELKAFFKKG